MRDQGSFVEDETRHGASITCTS